MSLSVAQSRQHLSALIDAAQSEPQVITKRNTPVAVLVSAAYFKQAQAQPAPLPVAADFFSQLMVLREAYPPQDDLGLEESRPRATAWVRDNPFADAP